MSTYNRQFSQCLECIQYFLAKQQRLYNNYKQFFEGVGWEVNGLPGYRIIYIMVVYQSGY